jgi:hypothetical protein
LDGIATTSSRNTDRQVNLSFPNSQSSRREEIVNEAQGNHKSLQNNQSTDKVSKPMLYQLAKRRTESGNHNLGGSSAEQYEWKGMGIYDDGDLDEVSRLRQ